MEIYGLKINGLHNPIGYDYDTPLCSWKVRNSKGHKQVYARISLSLDIDMKKIIYEKDGDLKCVGERLELELEPYTRYFYQITVESDVGEVVKSQVQFFETGKLKSPWCAKWIGINGEDIQPRLQRSFSTKEQVKRARLYICGLGLFEAYINGTKCGADQLAPFINDYEEHFQYCTYDVTDLVKEKNTISVLLGNGWYRGRFGLDGASHYERPLALIAELHITYTSGEIEKIITDEHWKYRDSFITYSDIYNGERQDYLKPLKEWKKVKIVEVPGRLCARYSLPLHDMERIPVKEVIRTKKGELVLDFGQNFAGHVVCTQLIPKSVTMTWEFGEVMQEGNFYNENYRTAESKFVYISDGVKREIRPHFTYYGFRYLKISGVTVIDPSCFEGRAIYSEMDQTGYMHTGNKKINRLITNSLWGFKSNAIDMPTDCPQRDERLGWTGDAQVFCTTAGFYMDTRAFYSKFLRDLRSDQKRNNGAVAVYLPNTLKGLYAGAWSDAATIIPKMLFEYYGNDDTLIRNYSLMKDWVDFIYEEDCKRGKTNLYNFGFQFGDWLALDGSTEQSFFGRTDNHYVSSMYYYASTKYVAEAARYLGYVDEKCYEERAQRIKNAILSEYFTGTGRLAIDTQTGYLLALKFGVYKDKQRLIVGFKKRFKKDLNRMKGGFIGATMMNCVLAENDMLDIAYDLLFYEGFPGWLYAVNLGATTIWERWNSILSDGTISGTDMNSLNHYSYGSVIEFLYRYAAGIVPLKPGFQKVKIKPYPEIRLGYVECSYDSAYGTYISNWRIEENGMVSFHIEIPFGCDAEIHLPEQDVIYAKAGVYDFHLRLKKDYRTLYSADTPLERLFKDKRAVEVLKKYLPELYYGTKENDIEAMSKSLNDSKMQNAMFGGNVENYDKAIAEICQIIAE
ncbi:MAG: family 78 glycoside hydrolase catalytic domain [Agathobacter sp.]|nr:family 78 glycoside hydrolase catalytic domain [Agathobacter sp.]